MSLNSVDFENLLGSEDQMAKEITNLWTSWNTARQSHKDRIAEVLAYLYATDTTTTSNSSNGWNHNTNLPKITNISDNLKANYSSGLMPKPKFFKFEGEDKESVKRTTRASLEDYLVTKHRQSGFREAIQSLIDDWTDQGNCFAGVTYLNEAHTHPDTGEVIQGYRGPSVYRIDPNDIVFNPLATSFKNSPKVIRTVHTMGSLARQIEDNPDMGYLQDVFSRVSHVRQLAIGTTTDDLDKYSQMEFDGFGSFGQYIQEGFVEILDFYGDMYDIETGEFLKNHVISIVDRRWVIRKQAVDTWDGRPMIFHAGWRKRVNNLWYMSPLENLLGMQYKINHLENARADAFDAMLSPDRVIRGDVEDEVTEANGAKTYYMSEAGDVRNLVPDATVLNADFQIRETEEKMELYAGSPREAAGVRTPGEKTKFEVGELSNARGRIFQHKMNQFEVGIMEDLLNAELSIAKEYIPISGDLVRLDDEDDGSKIFKNITKEDLTANGTIKAVGARHFAKQAQLAQNMQVFQQMMQTDEEMKLHIPSIKLANMWQEMLEFEDAEMVVPYARIAERLQAQRLEQAAVQTASEEEAVGDEELVTEEV